MKTPIHVYVLRTEILGGGVTKVGISACPECRCRHLRGRKTEDLRVVRSWPRNGDARKIENRVHKALAEYKAGGEWFRVSPAAACRAVEKVIREFE